MKQHFTKAEKEAYHQGQACIKAAHERFDSFMSEHGWTKYHLFMRGSKWTKDADTIIHDRDGWHLNGQKLTEKEIHQHIHYPNHDRRRIYQRADGRTAQRGFPFAE